MSEVQSVDSNLVSAAEWKGCWEEGKIDFHQVEVTASLMKHWSHVVSQLPTNKRDGLTVLVPLCGATRDLVWLLSRPEVSSVCGIEVSELALQRLLTENPGLGGDASHRRVVGPGVECWESSDGRLKFYLGDLFSDCLLAELKSSCHVLWDRGALVAIDVPDRERYVRRLRDMCATEHAWLMELVEYDVTKYGGPPHSLSEDDVRRLLEGPHRVQLLDSPECPSQAEKFKVPAFNLPAYLVSGI